MTPSHRLFDLVVIGASAGGVSAVRRLLSRLSPDFSLPIIVVQHMPAMARTDIGLVYGVHPFFNIVEVEDKMPIVPGVIYMAAPNYHLLLEPDHSVALSQDERVHFSRPSIDVTFEAAARAYGSKVVGILLTGANHDGAEGLRIIELCGGLVIVQDPDEAENPVMPRAGLECAQNAKVLRLRQISDLLNHISVDAEERV